MFIRFFVSSGNSLPPSVFVFCTAATRGPRTNLLFMPIYIMRLKTKLYASRPPGARICAETLPENFQRSSPNLWKIIRGKMFSIIQRIADSTLFRGNWLPLQTEKRKNRLSGKGLGICQEASQPEKYILHCSTLNSFTPTMKRTVFWVKLND